MDPDPFSITLLSVFQPWDMGVVFSLLLMAVMLVLSALISGSEVAYFSLSPHDREQLTAENSKSATLVTDLLSKPNTLLATILIGNNLVNVAIIILSSFLMEMMFDFGDRDVLAFVIQVIAVTLIILIVGEISPKVYASKQAYRLSIFMAYPLSFMRKLFAPLSKIMVRSTRKINAKAKETEGASSITADDLSHAIELTSDKNTEESEKRILSGIVKFGTTEVRQVMTPRIDVESFDLKLDFKTLQEKIVDRGFSRIPVHEETFDTVVGVLYVKDMLPHLDEGNDFDWKSLLRPPVFVTENKKLDDLLRDFQATKNHMAIVVDEYGGSSGIITLEDIIEEIVGEISDEFDEDDIVYSKLDENNYVFEGKTALIDLYRILDIDGDLFEQTKGESDSIAGFILELCGRIPVKNEKIRFEQYQFTIEAADKRKVKQVKVTISTSEEE
ncbi:MAG: gliding motility-associated protein GldE [Flavobacteriales bacterium]|nr:gliding motility-associated protein GldE [Flavobacteriales bacterium]